MKKLLLCILVLFAISPQVQAQVKTYYTSSKPASTSTVVADVLHYYLNKHYFKTGSTDLSTYPSYKTDATALASSTAITYCGSRFDVPAGETVTITGLEAYVKKSASNFVNTVIPIHLYLFNLDPVTGMPVMPPIDSISTGVNGTATLTPALIGGNFTNTATSGAKVMTSSFAVCLRNMSPTSGDYAYLVRTAGVTQTNTSAPSSEKYSDGYGFVRHNGKFYSTTNFTIVPDFGVGTDYEFMVAPRVTYSLQASQVLPQGVTEAGDLVNVPDTMCTRTLLTFTNTSSGFYEHRQYNLNQFYRKWNLYSAFPQSVAGAFSADSSLTWYFEFYEGNPETRVFLPYANNHTISAITDQSEYPECFTTNEFRARLKPMDGLGVGAQYIYNENFTVCFKFCNGDGVGIKSNVGYENFKMYPNPVVNGKTLISGLRGKTTLILYDVLGQVISKEVTENNSQEIDLSKQPKGTYMLRINNSENQTKVVKILNQN